MVNNDVPSRITLLAKNLIEASTLEEFVSHLEKVSKIDIITSDEIRNALLSRPMRVFCLLRRSRIEGREPPSFSWITPFQEFLLSSSVQNELRRSNALQEIFTEFSHILNSKKTKDIEIRECLRIIHSTPLLADYAWSEIYRSSLTGLVNLIETTEDIPSLLPSVLQIGSILKNRKIMDAVNSRCDTILGLITGKKNPVLANGLLGAICALAGNPWFHVPTQKNMEFDLLAEDLRNSILGRFSKSIPKKEKLLSKENNSLNIKYLEESITKLGWVFIRNYLIYLATVHNVLPDHLHPIALSQEPMGRIRSNYILYCLRNGIPLPFQILQSALGEPREYVLDIEILETEYNMSEFESNCPDLTHIIQIKNIRENHLVNGRTGLRLDETYLGTRGIIRTLLDRDEEITGDIASKFIEGLITSHTIPISVKKRARDTLKLMNRE